MLLVNESSFSRWMQSAQAQAPIRLAAFQQQISSASEWWSRVRAAGEGKEFRRIGSDALITIEGALSHRYGFMNWIYESDCYVGIAAKIRAAAADPDVTRIILQVNSPGGIHHGCPEAADAIWAARQVKPVIGVVDPEAASAAYFLASQATRLIGLRSGWIGSLGTQILLYSQHRMLTEAGIDIEVIRASVSPNKNLGIPYEPISDAARAERRGWVDQAASEFVAAVARGRGVSESHVRENYGQGSMLFMPQAIDRGMADAVGTLQSLLSPGSAATQAITSRTAASGQVIAADQAIDLAVRRYLA